MKHSDSCFCEIAPLYALDILEEEDRRVVEQCMAELPELEIELEEFQVGVAAIPYSLPDVAIAPGVKDRLFQRIANVETLYATCLQPAAIAPPPIGPPIPPFTVRAGDVRWRNHPVPGVTMARLSVDKAKREIVCLLRAEPGVTYPPHRHAAVEEIFMLEGDLEVDGEVYGRGDYIRSSPGSIHSPYTSTGCMFFIRTSIDDEMLN